MTESDCSCDDPDLVVVRDRNMALPYVCGNPFSRYCTNCGRRYFCKESFWDNASEKWVIPNGDDEPIPIEDYDEENFFECPECDSPHFGFPDGCECGAKYQWDSETTDS